MRFTAVSTLALAEQLQKGRKMAFVGTAIAGIWANREIIKNVF